MKIRFVYEYKGLIYPACIVATRIYYDPEDSTFCISDGVDWWDIVMTENRANNWMNLAFKGNAISFPYVCIFRFAE